MKATPESENLRVQDSAAVAAGSSRVSESKSGRLRGRWLLAITIGLALLIFASRWPYVQGALERKIANFDEISLTSTTLGTLLGVPPRFLSWPASPQRFILIQALVLDYLAQHGAAVDAESFVSYVGEACRSPWRALMILRVMTALAVSIGFSVLFPAIVRHTGSVAAGVVAVVILAAHPSLFPLSYWAMADGLSLAAAAAAIACLLSRPAGTLLVVLAGLLTGLALASKVTITMAFPLIGLLLLSNARRPLKAVVLFTATAVIVFLLSCPFVLTEPLRMLKSLTGNLNTPGQSEGAVKVIQLLSRCLGIVGTLAVIAATVVALASPRRKWALVIGTWASAAYGVVATMGAARVCTKYYTPLLIIGVVFCTVILWPSVVAWLGRRGSKRPAFQVVGAIGLAALLVVYVTHDHRFANPQRYRNLFEVADDLAAMPPSTRVIVSDMTSLLL